MIPEKSLNLVNHSIVKTR